MLYAPVPMQSGSIFSQRKRTLTRPFAGAGAALLLAALGTSSPVLAETTVPVAPISVAALLPAAIQASALETGLNPVSDEAVAPMAEDAGEHIGTGLASWYGKEFKGRRTASGEKFNPTELTAAHPSLPFGSLVRVTNTKTGQNVVVRINDRGPYTHKRLIDVSQAAARELGLIGPGSGQVSISLLAG
ncbi:septal ring lytic transglycosylase RlpA family protein [Altererythrobacter sp. CC-YST694]|nr:septal ring lytic transglycosylase RlpA family protein [Altererythrobacter sp. CC-YST694]